MPDTDTDCDITRGKIRPHEARQGLSSSRSHTRVIAGTQTSQRRQLHAKLAHVESSQARLGEFPVDDETRLLLLC
jgi:hypothetical protein